MAVLDRNHAPRGEAAAVANAIHFIDDRYFRIAADQEVGVQRMRRPRRDVVDGAACRHQRLTEHLTPEHALPARLRGAPAKQIHFERFKVENPDQILNGGSHGVSGGWFCSFWVERGAIVSLGCIRDRPPGQARH
jgi:hypothetical protein